MMFRQIQWNTVKRMSLPARVAATVFGIIVILPILLLVLVAGTFAGIVFGVLFLINIIIRKGRSLTGRDNEGRKNVRVRR